MKLGRAAIVGWILVALATCTARDAFAHRDDYLNETIVYLTLEQRELEVEYWLDYGWRPGGSDDFVRHNSAVEYGITNHWMVDGRVTALSPRGQQTEFDSGRLETRYRFSDEGVRPVDVAVSLEANSEREADGSHTAGLEPRLILSKDVAEKLNFTANFSEEISLDSGSSAFLTAFGSRFNWTPLVRVGGEFQYDTGAGAGAAIPQVWFAFGRGVTLKTGAAIGVGNEQDNFVRTALEVEF